MIGKMKWKKNVLNRKLSRYSTIADEAMALLIVENIAPDLQSLLNTDKFRYTNNDLKKNIESKVHKIEKR